MRWNSILVTTCLVGALARAADGQVDPQAPPPTPPDPLQVLIDRLDLEKYKATIKGLTAFGDRREGTERNRKAVDWIESQLKSYGCTNTERIVYTHPSPEAADPAAAGRGRGAGQRGRGAGRGAEPAGGGPRRGLRGGGTQFGPRARTGVYEPDAPGAAPLDPRLRTLTAEPTTPGERQEVYCTKIGSTRPDEMYIVGGHMDGIGWGEAANDDGSGTAIVMELARIFSAPDVRTERSIRFVLWNNEETGLNGAWAYVNQRKDRQGLEDPPGSGRFPEPKWLGMIQHDMMMWDHGMPGRDGKVSPEQRPEADVNIEFQSTSRMATEAQALAWVFKTANEKYATDYPAAVGPHMSNTDSVPFMDLVPAISLRENERGPQVGAGWDPNWHQPSDVFATYTDKDFRLGLNAAQTTLGALGRLAGASLTKAPADPARQ